VSVISILLVATYVAYVFITASYARKVWKVARMPVHLRWELYPIPFGKGHEYGGSYFEEVEWWTKPQPKSRIQGALHLAKKYLFFGGYFKLKRDYWVSLYPWHVGFYLLMGFQLLTILCALIMTFTGIQIAAGSVNVLGQILYYLSEVVAITGFVLGAAGSVGLLIKRLSNADLRDYTAPSEYFGYAFFLVTFLSGLAMWITDPTLANYRDFYKSLVTFQPVNLLPSTAVFSIIFVLHLFHLPFTRSTHYITKMFAFLGVLWNDSPNITDAKLGKRINAALDQTVSWSAPHIQTGKKWIEVVRELPESMKGKGTK
jgi:nitrate reductase gamma subunit